jgi:hypothetical protein
MKTIGHADLKNILDEAGIEAADPRVGIGRQLVFRPPSSREVLVWVGENQPADLTREVVLHVVALSPAWLLIPRWGAVSGLELLPADDASGAILFESAERSELATYLRTRSMDMGGSSADLYVLSRDGNTLVTWDHHTEDVGLRVELKSVQDTSELLVGLNEIGAEIDGVYAVDPDEWARAQAPLLEIDGELESFAKANDMWFSWTYDERLRGRELTWGRGVCRKINIAVADANRGTFTLSVSAYDDPKPILIPRKEVIREDAEFPTLRNELAELLEIGRERAEALAAEEPESSEDVS